MVGFINTMAFDDRRIPVRLRSSSLTCDRYYRSSRLAALAPRPSRYVTVFLNTTTVAGSVTLRFVFPYKEKGKKSPGVQEKLVHTWANDRQPAVPPRPCNHRWRQSFFQTANIFLTFGIRRDVNVRS